MLFDWAHLEEHTLFDWAHLEKYKQWVNNVMSTRDFQPGVKTLLNSLEQHIFDQIVLIHAAWHSILPLFEDGTNVPHYALNLKISFPAMPGLAPASIYNILCVKTLVVVNMLSPWLHYVRYLCWKRKVLLRGLFVLKVLWEGFFFLEKSFLEDLSPLKRSKVLPGGL